MAAFRAIGSAAEQQFPAAEPATDSGKPPVSVQMRAGSTGPTHQPVALVRVTIPSFGPFGCGRSRSGSVLVRDVFVVFNLPLIDEKHAQCNSVRLSWSRG